MPVLLNTSTGFVEDLPQQHADAALSAGTHEIPLVGPDGMPVSSPLASVGDLLAQGHAQPSAEQLQSLLDHAEFSSTPEQLKTFAEGAAKSASFGLSTGLERGLGISSAERIRKREETNPGIATAGEVAGLLAPGGALKVISKAGTVAKAATGLGGVGSSYLSRVAGQGVKAAVEGALIQSGNEVSKMFVEDPEQSAETALVHIGLAAALGAGAGGLIEGALAPAAKGIRDSQLGQFLGALKGKALETEAQTVAADAAQAAGIELAPEIKAAIKGGKGAEFGQELAESSTAAGHSYRDAVAKTYTDAADTALSALGKTRESISSAPSSFEAGQELGDKLATSLKEQISPISKKFDDVSSKFATAEIDAASKNGLAERLSKLSIDEGYALSESSAGQKEINRILKDLPNLRTLEDLRRYQAVARENAMATQVPGLARKVGGVLRDAEESLVEARLASKHPDLLESHQATRAEYRSLMNRIDDLNDRLHVGPYHGPDSFVKALGEMRPETVLSRLGNVKDAGLLELLNKEFPQVAQTVRDYHVNTAVSKLAHANPDKLNINKMLKAIDGWSPELKKFVLSDTAKEQLNQVKGILDALPERLNPSGTARTADELLKHIPGGIGAIIGGLSGHGPMGFILGHASRLLGRELPDQGKLAILKMLGTEGSINVPGFRALVKATEALHKGDTAIRASVSSLFKGGSEAFPKALIPAAADRKKLDNQLKIAADDPSVLIHAANRDSHYLPEQAAATGATLSRATQYLNSLRPSTEPLSMFGSKRVPSEVEQAKYDRALDIAQQPLMVVKHIKDGTLTPQDITTISTIHPKLYNTLKDKMMSEAISAHTEERLIPYRTLQSLSLFVGMPLDASLMPSNIALNQSKPPTGPQGQQGPSGPARGQTKALNPLAGAAATPAQAREQHRIAK